MSGTDDGAGFGPEERRQLDALSRALDRWATEAGERLRVPETDAVGAGPASPRGSRRSGKREASARRTGRGLRWGFAVLAAAAAAGVFLIARGPAPDAPAAPGGVILSADGLDVASDRSFMVVPTRNPDIAVVWMLDSGD